MHYYDPSKVKSRQLWGLQEPQNLLCSSFSFLPCQNDDDPLGSIPLRGSVVTAVDFVPDGKPNRYHMTHTHTYTHAASLPSPTRPRPTKFSRVLPLTCDLLLSPRLICSFPPLFSCSQKTRRWQQLLWDNHFGWGSLFPAGGRGWREEGVDPSGAGSSKMWQIEAKNPHLNSTVVTFTVSYSKTGEKM